MLFSHLKNNMVKLALLIVFSLIFNGKVYSQNNQEVVITITSSTNEEKMSHFNMGEDFRNDKKYEEAIAEYEEVIKPGLLCGKESEAHYNIGLCYTWLNEKNKADSVFNEVIRTYADDGYVVSFAKYGLSWLEVQRGNYYKAIDILEKELNNPNCKDYEHRAVMQFKIGKIYLKYLLDFNKAQEIFAKVKNEYPDAGIMNHPYLSKMTKK